MVKKFSLIFLSLIMFVCGFFIVNDRFANINSVNASQTIDNMFTPYNVNFTNNWLSYTVNSDTFTSGVSSSFFGSYVWTDSTNIYFSNFDKQLVFDKINNTWSTKTWTGLTSFVGSYVWTDGTNYYYSSSSSQYILDISTSTWSTKTWTGLTSFNGNNVWSDGTNYYYSEGSSQYILDISTSTWSTKTWTGLTSFSGNNVWTDGTNVYYSSSSYHYILDIFTSTWSTKTWTGLISFFGPYVWTDGTNYYYSEGSSQYILDISTSTWSTKTWTGLTSFNGSSVFYDNDVVICYLSSFTSSNSFYRLDYTIDNSSGGETGGGDETNTYYHFTGSTFNVSAFMSNDAYVTANIYFDIEDISATQFTLKFNYKLLYGYGNNGFSYNVDSDYTVVSYTLDLNTDYSNSFTSGASADSPFMISYTTDNWTNSDITSCIINSGDGIYNSNFNIGTFVDGYGLVTYTFQYFNSLNEDFNIAIQSTYNKTYLSSNPLLLSNRTYYFSQSSAAGSGAYTDGYNAGYNDGVEDGFSNGQNVGRQEAYDSGYNYGYERGSQYGYINGKAAGRLEGIESANEYSFFGLISAVIDAPINAFTSLFNFNILGINILNLITGLITLLICITVLKFLMGGK